ncbi:unnamed protein product [Sphagnum troendelagicum]|uniref:Uncharacterized protein n=1 Tax=Sphagnum troendelagicum TaxID=128251 RepID=A0ABP0TSM5_9BRYO
MASSVGDVLDIKSVDFYIKRPAGPMVTIEVKGYQQAGRDNHDTIHGRRRRTGRHNSLENFLLRAAESM